jgi:chromosome segregation ATPase
MVFLMEWMDRTKITAVLIVMIVYFMMMPAFAQSNDLKPTLAKNNEQIVKTKNEMMTTDAILDARQQQLESVEYKGLTVDKNAIARDVDNASADIGRWKGDISNLEKSMNDTKQKSANYQLSPQDRSDLNKNMADFQNNIDDLKNRIDSIEKKKNDIQSKVK